MALTSARIAASSALIWVTVLDYYRIIDISNKKDRINKYGLLRLILENEYKSASLRIIISDFAKRTHEVASRRPDDQDQQGLRP